MKAKLALVLLIAAILAVSVSGKNWAVLVAGSNNWFNYRHQADVLNAYQLLKKTGIAEENIIVFAYDDIANNARNPFPGKIFNKPTFEEPGKDVYAGAKIDYSGADVTPQTFMDVLKGDKDAVKGKGTESIVEIECDLPLFFVFGCFFFGLIPYSH